MRFILNFIFFGVLFYAIYLFFPDVFHTLVTWANAIYEFLKDIIMQISGRVQEWKQDKVDHHPVEHALFFVPLWVATAFKKM